MKPDYAKYLIRKTKQDFDKIAEHFSETRKRIWPEIEELKEYIKEGEKMLDVGCGNGRLFEFFLSQNKRIDYTGIDVSEKLVKIAQRRYGNYFKVANILNLPFKDNSFDTVWAIAVFHHIPSKGLRLKALKEIKRVLKNSGRVIITCWNLFQLRYFKLLLKYTFIKLFRGSELDFKDLLIPWKEKDVVIERYHHAFTKRELRKLFKKAGFKIEKLQYLKRRNKKFNILAIGVKSE